MDLPRQPETQETARNKRQTQINSLEFVLNKLLERCEAFSSENNVKNVLLFFYGGKSKAPLNINEAFTPIGIDYGKEVLGNYVLLQHLSFYCQ